MIDYLPSRKKRLTKQQTKTKNMATKTKQPVKKATKNAAAPAKGVVANKATPPVKATATAKAGDKVPGVTEMTKEKHSYEGYSVRAQKDGHVFRQYVSASDRVRTAEKNADSRKKAALAEANALRLSLGEIIDAPKSWASVGIMRPGAIKAIKALGFKHELPKD